MENSELTDQTHGKKKKRMFNIRGIYAKHVILKRMFVKHMQYIIHFLFLKTRTLNICFNTRKTYVSHFAMCTPRFQYAF